MDNLSYSSPTVHYDFDHPAKRLKKSDQNEAHAFYNEAHLISNQNTIDKQSLSTDDPLHDLFDLFGPANLDYLMLPQHKTLRLVDYVHHMQYRVPDSFYHENSEIGKRRTARTSTLLRSVRRAVKIRPWPEIDDDRKNGVDHSSTILQVVENKKLRATLQRTLDVFSAFPSHDIVAARIEADDANILLEKHVSSSPQKNHLNLVQFTHPHAITMAELDSYFHVSDVAEPWLTVADTSSNTAFTQFLCWKSRIHGKRAKVFLAHTSSIGVSENDSKHFEVFEKCSVAWADISKYLKLVHRVTENRGVHLFICDMSPSLLTDGGSKRSDVPTSLIGDEPDAFLEARLLLYNLAIAVHALEQRGSLVLRLWTCTSPFTISLLYIIDLLFEEVHFFTPETSLFGSCDRYLVAKGFSSEAKSKEHIRACLASFHRRINTVASESIVDFEKQTAIPIDVIVKDEYFLQWLTGSNLVSGRFQQNALLRIYHAITRNAAVVQPPNQSRFAYVRALEWGLVTEVADG